MKTDIIVDWLWFQWCDMDSLKKDLSNVEMPYLCALNIDKALTKLMDSNREMAQKSIALERANKFDSEAS